MGHEVFLLLSDWLNRPIFWQGLDSTLLCDALEVTNKKVITLSLLVFRQNLPKFR